MNAHGCIMQYICVTWNENQLLGSLSKNDNFISRSVRGAESNGKGPRCMR